MGLMDSVNLGGISGFISEIAIVVAYTHKLLSIQCVK